MYICVCCHGITDCQIEACIDAGARTLCALRGELGVATQCGCCEAQVREMLAERLTDTGAHSTVPTQQIGQIGEARSFSLRIVRNSLF